MAADAVSAGLLAGCVSRSQHSKRHVLGCLNVAAYLPTFNTAQCLPTQALGKGESAEARVIRSYATNVSSRLPPYVCYAAARSLVPEGSCRTPRE